MTPWPHQVAIARRAVETYPRSYLLRRRGRPGQDDRGRAGHPRAARERQGDARPAPRPGVGDEAVAGGARREVRPACPAARSRRLLATSTTTRSSRRPGTRGGRSRSCSPARTSRGGRAGGTKCSRQVRGTSFSSTRPTTLAGSAPSRTGRRTAAAAPAWTCGTPRRGKALYLASATPMQMHAHEAWDLLALLGLTGHWGKTSEPFVRYYEELRAAVRRAVVGLPQDDVGRLLQRPGRSPRRGGRPPGQTRPRARGLVVHHATSRARV